MNPHIPTSELGWIDFSDNDRQKVLKVIELLKGEGTVDELGIGVIRNSLSDAMFPGITTIMTRAKYYYIVPRILHDFMVEKPGRISAKEYLRRKENEIMNFLSVQNNFEDKIGIIGISVAKQNKELPQNKWEELHRKPSAIYWNAIGQNGFKIYTGKLSLANLLDLLDRKIKPDSAYTYIPTEGETSNDRDAENTESYFLLPDHPKDWQKNLTIELTVTEADFLKHKIIDQFPESLLAKVVVSKAATRDFLKSSSFGDMCDMPFVNKLPTGNVAILKTAKSFWEILYGAHIRFNVLLHSKPKGNKQYLEEVEGYWNEWVYNMKEFDWNSFDRNLMWSITKGNSRVKGHTETFVNNWIDLTEQQQFQISALDALVLKQEGDNKKSRSKLKTDHDDYYEGWTGISDMDFRFRNAKVIIKDIADKI